MTTTLAPKHFVTVLDARLDHVVDSRDLARHATLCDEPGDWKGEGLCGSYAHQSHKQGVAGMSFSIVTGGAGRLGWGLARERFVTSTPHPSFPPPLGVQDLFHGNK